MFCESCMLGDWAAVALPLVIMICKLEPYRVFLRGVRPFIVSYTDALPDLTRLFCKMLVVLLPTFLFWNYLRRFVTEA